MDARPLKRKLKQKRSKHDKISDDVNRNDQFKVVNVSGI